MKVTGSQFADIATAFLEEFAGCLCPHHGYIKKNSVIASGGCEDGSSADLEIEFGGSSADLTELTSNYKILVSGGAGSHGYIRLKLTDYEVTENLSDWTIPVPDLLTKPRD